MTEKVTDVLVSNLTEKIKGVSETLKACVDLLEAQVAEVKKPELRHGDYGLDAGGDACVACKTYREGRIIGTSGSFVHNDAEPESKNFKPETILGNIFDDLKASLQPLTEFDVQSRYAGNKMSVRVHGGRDICIVNGSVDTLLAPSQFDDFILNLRRLQHTLRSKKSD